MKKNIKAETELNEEQLQNITGGCVQCVSDLTKVPRRLETAQNLLSQSEVARAANDRRRANSLNASANAQLRQAQILLDRVAARGHRPPVPDLNLPAPRN